MRKAYVGGGHYCGFDSSRQLYDKFRDGFEGWWSHELQATLRRDESGKMCFELEIEAHYLWISRDNRLHRQNEGEIK